MDPAAASPAPAATSTAATVLDTLGAEVLAVMSPVSICMALVVLLISLLAPPSSSGSAAAPPPVTAATLVYLESPTDSPAQKLLGALLDATVFVALVAVVTFVLVALYYYRCTGFLKNYMRFSAFFVLFSMGGAIAVAVLRRLGAPLDAPTALVLLLWSWPRPGTMNSLRSSTSHGLRLARPQVLPLMLRPRGRLRCSRW